MSLPLDSALDKPPHHDVLAAVGGDREAYGRLIAEHIQLVGAIVHGSVRDAAARDDLVQEVFLEAWRGIRSLRSPATFRSWLCQIARNRTADWLRVQYRVTGIRSGEDVDGLPSEGNQEEDAIRRQEVDELRSALEGLPAEAREVLILYYREGESVAEVARHLEIREDAVRKRMSRARGMLRAEVLARLGEELVRTAPGAALVAAILGSLSPAPAMAGDATAMATDAIAMPRSHARAIASAVAVGLMGTLVVSLLVWASPPSGSVIASDPPPGSVDEVASASAQLQEPALWEPGVPAPGDPNSAPVGFPRPETPTEAALFAYAHAAGFGVVRCDLSAFAWRDIVLSGAFERGELREGVLTMAVRDEEWELYPLRTGEERDVALLTWGGAYADTLVPCTGHPPFPEIEDPDDHFVGYIAVGDRTLTTDDPEGAAALHEAVLASIEQFVEELPAQRRFDAMGVTPVDVALEDPSLSPEARAILESWRTETLSLEHEAELRDEFAAMDTEEFMKGLQEAHDESLKRRANAVPSTPPATTTLPE